MEKRKTSYSWHNSIGKASIRLAICMGRPYEYLTGLRMTPEGIRDRFLNIQSPKPPSSKGVIYKKQVT